MLCASMVIGNGILNRLFFLLSLLVGSGRHCEFIVFNYLFGWLIYRGFTFVQGSGLGDHGSERNSGNEPNPGDLRYRAGAFAIKISYLMRYSPAAVMGRHSGV